jgi:hypothetical protein
MIPQSGIGEEKSKLSQARLQEVCFFAASVARRLHPRPSESFDSIAPALSRIRPDARLWLVSLQSRSSRSLLKLEQLILCALCALWSKCFWIIGTHREPLQYFEPKIFRNLLEACTSSAYARSRHGCPSLETQVE